MKILKEVLSWLGIVSLILFMLFMIVLSLDKTCEVQNRLQEQNTPTEKGVEIKNERVKNI